jgi:hypothetical protein
MQSKMLLFGWRVSLTIVAVVLATNTWAAGQTTSSLYNFNPDETSGSGQKVGNGAISNLIWDNSGVNLYGETARGGNSPNCGESTPIIYGCGTIFELTPPATAGKQWTATVLHTFGSDGDYAPSGGLTLDADGNLYGTTIYGGAYGACCQSGGTVFELSPPATAGGAWKYKSLYSFGKSYSTREFPDGQLPYGGVILDANGNLYGTTSAGGQPQICAVGSVNGCGTVFELLKPATSTGTWTEKILHTFYTTNFSTDTDGQNPMGGLTWGPDGGLYGTTVGGGYTLGGTDPCSNSYGNGCGIVFELTPAATGPWPEKKLHTFAPGSRDGYQPYASLVFDSSGVLWGTTALGGAGNPRVNSGYGIVFNLTPGATTPWAESVVHIFTDKANNGAYPGDGAGLTYDATTGILYGTTVEGGVDLYYGTIYSCTTSACRVDHNFLPSTVSPYGANPVGGLLLDSSGNLYGTTTTGGKNSYGTVFEFTP